MTKRNVGRSVTGPQLCDMCAELLLIDGRELSDGRVLCRTCERTGLHEATEIEGVRQHWVNFVLLVTRLAKQFC